MLLHRVACLGCVELMYRQGFQSKELIVKAGLRLGDVDQYPVIDVTIDGADECGRTHFKFYQSLTNMRSVHLQGRPRPELYQRWRGLPSSRESAR
jgi:hypothetical protein